MKLDSLSTNKMPTQAHSCPLLDLLGNISIRNSTYRAQFLGLGQGHIAIVTHTCVWNLGLSCPFVPCADSACPH